MCLWADQLRGGGTELHHVARPEESQVWPSTFSYKNLMKPIIFENWNNNQAINTCNSVRESLQTIVIVGPGSESQKEVSETLAAVSALLHLKDPSEDQPDLSTLGRSENPNGPVGCSARQWNAVYHNQVRRSSPAQRHASWRTITWLLCRWTDRKNATVFWKRNSVVELTQKGIKFSLWKQKIVAIFLGRGVSSIAGENYHTICHWHWWSTLTLVKYTYILARKTVLSRE